MGEKIGSFIPLCVCVYDFLDCDLVMVCLVCEHLCFYKTGNVAGNATSLEDIWKLI